MLKRIITSVVSLIVFFAVVIAGVIPFQAAIAIVSLVMLYEVYGAVTKSKEVKACGYIVGIILLLGLNITQRVIPGERIMTENLLIAIISGIGITMFFLVFSHGKITYRELFAAAFMTFYIVIFMGFISKMRVEFGLRKMGLIFLVAWGSDTSAYFCGTFFGKHKLIPKVSPKKTIEGSVGAIICVAIACAIYGFVLSKIGKPITNSYWMLAVLGIICSAVSQFGDLTASAIKRDADIKDYGKIFPGHGGFMDRFDSVIFISPLVYYMVSILL